MIYNKAHMHMGGNKWLQMSRYLYTHVYVVILFAIICKCMAVHGHFYFSISKLYDCIWYVGIYIYIIVIPSLHFATYNPCVCCMDIYNCSVQAFQFHVDADEASNYSLPFPSNWTLAFADAIPLVFNVLPHFIIFFRCVNAISVLHSTIMSILQIHFS